MIRSYTDGACRGNPGLGGWGMLCYVVENSMLSNYIERGGYSNHSTNNKMELQGVIESMKYLINESKTNNDIIEIYTDSEYVIKGTNEWMASWIRRGWLTAAKKPVMNQDYWKELSNLKFTLEKMKNKVTLKYVPGHAGVKENERVDTIATTCAIEQKEFRSTK